MAKNEKFKEFVGRVAAQALESGASDLEGFKKNTVKHEAGAAIDETYDVVVVGAGGVGADHCAHSGVGCRKFVGEGGAAGVGASGFGVISYAAHVAASMVVVGQRGCVRIVLANDGADKFPKIAADSTCKEVVGQRGANSIVQCITDDAAKTICITATSYCTYYSCGAGTATDGSPVVLSGNAANICIAREGDVAEDVAVLNSAAL